MTLREMQIDFTKQASRLGEFQLLTKTELANGYCDAEEAGWACKEAGDVKGHEFYEDLRSQYYAALCLRYWYKIFRWMKDSASLNLAPEDFVEWLDWTFWDAFYYRQWRWEWKAEVKHGHFIEWKLDKDGNRIPNPYYWRVDPNAPDKIINRCAGSARGYFYQYHNKDKRKADVQAYSIESMVDENGDCSLDYVGCITPGTEINGVTELINALLSKGKGIEALIIDGIVNYDSYKTTDIKETVIKVDEETGEEYSDTITTSTSEFNARKLVKHLNTVNQEFMQRFIQDYDLSKDAGIELYGQLKSMTNSKLYKSIKKTLLELRESKKYLSYLM